MILGVAVLLLQSKLWQSNRQADEASPQKHVFNPLYKKRNKVFESVKKVN